MTGQEWYERFEKELEKEDWIFEKRYRGDTTQRDLVLEAAKKASGLK